MQKSIKIITIMGYVVYIILQKILIIELFYTTRIMVAKLCSININDINFNNKSILIYGKGLKE